MELYDSYNDDALFELMRNDSTAAFTVLYNRYWDRIFYIAAGKLKDPLVAEDVVQDIFTDLWNRRKEIIIKKDTAAYLAVAVKYRIINIQARIHKAQKYEAERIHFLKYTDDSIEAWINNKELYDLLYKEIQQLPEKARLAFQLNTDYEMRHKEIAALMNTSPKAVERSIARAVHSLKAALRKFPTTFFTLFYIFS